ncbi:unnamed protein product [Meganyctiphanes norvegica]|uniref:Uncharacterized protein n=1 Tax=Meganyctiphanes norvegica TaxID=48144 RepID=A0AAV2QL71_MEGNR
MRQLGLNMSDDTVALCLLEACDLSNEAQRHVIAAMPGGTEDMTYISMQETLHKIYSTIPKDTTQSDVQSGSQGENGEVNYYSGGRRYYRGTGRNSYSMRRSKRGFRNFSASPSRNGPYVRSTGAATSSYRKTNPVGSDGKISICTVCE